MRHVAYLSIGGHWDNIVLKGVGETSEEAQVNCLEQVTKHVTLLIEVAPDVTLPPEVVERMPTLLPDGAGLLIMERCSHSSGDSYDWRFFAVARGTHRMGYCGEFGEQTYTIGDQPWKYLFADCNAHYHYNLPPGSLEFVDGEWIPCEAAHYYY